MANLILKWRYIKRGTPKHARHHVKYIATRDGVEKCDESWKFKKSTRAQDRLIQDLIKDFPSTKKTDEYESYIKEKNKYTATRFISKAIDDNVDLIGKRENYVEYIAKRPRVEKQGKHGLFTQEDEVIDLEKTAKEVAEHKDLVWTIVLSLKREDAVRLGYDNAEAWKRLLREQSFGLAESMGIPLTELKWYGAFHNESDHPHVHIVAYSTGKKPYMDKKNLGKLKAKYIKEIFKEDLHNIYVEQTKWRDELREEGKSRIKEILEKIKKGEYDNPTVEALMVKLQDELKDYTGKKAYGYIPAKAKNLVNGIVDEIAKDDRIKELYELWYEEKENIDGHYTTDKPERIPLSQNEAFKPIRNAVIKEIYNAKYNEKREKERKISIKVGALRLFRYLGKIIGESTNKNSGGNIGMTDRKERQQIREKKEAQGLKLE